MTPAQKQAVKRVRDLAQNFLDWQIPSSPAAISQAGHDLSTLLALLDEQREALRPFLAAACNLEDALDLIDDPDDRDKVGLIFGGMDLGRIPYDDFRRAAALTGDQP